MAEEQIVDPIDLEYTFLDKSGEGGFAIVKKARHNELGYVRAVRMLKDFVSDKQSPIYQKFLEECKMLLRLGNGNHPNIVHIYKPDLIGHHALVEMDYIDGSDLHDLINEYNGFVPLEEVQRMVLEMSSALAYCHHDIYQYCMDRKKDNLQTDPNDGTKVLLDDATIKRLVNEYKVVHNDIHSRNIMRHKDGHYVLLDFGLAFEGNDVIRTSLLRNGAPEYKAPEKWDNAKKLTEQSDIYSFGIVMYEFLAGRVPFVFDKKNTKEQMALYDVMNAHLKQAPPPIRPFREATFRRNNPGKQYDEDYPQWLEDIIMRCLEKDPAKRFANGKELHEAIMNALSQKSEYNEKKDKRQKEETQQKKEDGKPPVELDSIPPPELKIKWWSWVVLSVDVVLILAIVKPSLFYLPVVEMGNASAQNNLGDCYYCGKGVPQDYDEAVKWYRKAAEQDNAVAQSVLGSMYYLGQGVPQDYAEAVKWFRKAAEQDNAVAQSVLGYMYEEGKGVPQDYDEAVKWYRKAAEQDNAVAQNNLGLMYYLGQGVPQDYDEAVKWYRKAAEQDNDAAQNSLGLMYYLGQGVPQDYAEAVKWFRKAAEQDNAVAQNNLGYMYEEGKGVSKNMNEALYWYQKAAAQGDKEAKKAVSRLEQ